MRPGEELRVDYALNEITMLLATAYRRRARIRLIGPVAGSLPSTEDLDKTAEPSPYELTLTRRRKELPRS